MFRKLQSVISPMSAMRIDPNKQSDLSTKLHMITQYLVNSSKQFDSWMQLQNNNRLHYCLYEMYQRNCQNGGNEEEMASIIQFYTLLIINCKDQLLICKLVSDDFVIEMCQLHNMPSYIAAELEAYRINLIKAYMSTITPQIVKYMIVQDKFKVFYICVQLYQSKIGTGTVQSTTIASSLLNVIKRVDSIPYLWQSIWVPQGLQLLLTECLTFIQQQLTGEKSKKQKSNKSISIKSQQNENKQPQKATQQQQLQFEKNIQQTNQTNNEKLSPSVNNQPQNVGNNIQNQETSSQKKQILADKQQQINDQVPKIQQNREENTQNQQNKVEQKKQKEDNIGEAKQQPNTQIQLQSSTNNPIIEQKQKNFQQQLQKQYRQSLQQAQLQIRQQFNKNNIDILQETVLFIIELNTSISKSEIKQEIAQYCYMDLEEILAIINKYEKFSSKVYSFSVLFAMFKTYNFEQEAVESVMSLWMEQILAYIGQNVDKTESEMESKEKQGKNQMNEMLCRTMFILCKIVSSKYSHLSQRRVDKIFSEQEAQKHQKMRIQILKILIARLQYCMEHLQTFQPSLLLHFIKNILLTAFNLKIAINFSLNQDKNDKNDKNETNTELKQLEYTLDQAILQLFLAYISQFKKLMYHNELWNSIIKWYEEGTNQVTQNLLFLSDTFEHITQDRSYIIMLTYEYIKNYRYMIVQSTTLDPKAIKQQKFYHSTFTSPGMGYAPGSIVTDILNVVCPCLLHHNYQQVPVVVIQDKQCFVIAIKQNENEYKILINIRFKDIQGLLYGNSQTTQGKNTNQLPKFVKINLRGMQQIILQFNNPKVVGNAFKDYLIRSRDMTRQRQLTFLNAWIKDYEIDAKKSLGIVKKYLKKQDHIMI